jgi:hypothetical protein
MPSRVPEDERSVATSSDSSIKAGYINQSAYLCHYDTGKITGYAVATCRDKEVSLTLRTATQKLKTTSNSL